MQIPTDCLMNSFQSQSLKKITCDLEEKNSRKMKISPINVLQWLNDIFSLEAKEQISREKVSNMQIFVLLFLD